MSAITLATSEDLLNHLIGSHFPEVLENETRDDLESKLTVYLNDLIDKDFSRLIQLLYRIDVSEEKLKKALETEDKSKSSGKTVAKLIIERQLQKLEFRKQFSKKKLEE